MRPNREVEEGNPQEQTERQIDFVSIYRTILRVVTHLEETDYNEENLRQAEV
jgi:hypothetical protein